MVQGHDQGPERDRRLAGVVRYGPRRATGIADLVERFMDGEEARRMRRFRAVSAALASALDASQRSTITPLRLSGGVLTLGVANHVLMAEYRGHLQHRLLQALIIAGSGVDRIVWRLKR